MMGSKLFVGNLGKQTTETELADLFSEFGAVANILIPRDYQTNAIKDYAFVEMESQELDGAVVEQMNGRKLHGRALRVTAIVAAKQVPVGRGMYNGRHGRKNRPHNSHD